MINSYDGNQNMGVCVVVVDDDNVLLGKRKNAYKSGWFGLPGGRLDIGEPFQDCGKRELIEETSLNDVLLTYVGIVREYQDDYDFFHIVYTGILQKKQPIVNEPNKCESWNWFPMNAIPEKTLPGHREAIKMFKNNKNLIDLHK